jgi:hypothetical protein
VSDTYVYDPDAWPPALAGVVAGAIGAIVAAIIGWILTGGIVENPHDYVNSLTVVIVSLALGFIAGMLWRRLRATNNASTVFAWTLVGGGVATVAAVLMVDQTVLSSLAPYVLPLVAIIFITLAFFTPIMSRVTAPTWIAAIPILLALAIGVGLFL